MGGSLRQSANPLESTQAAMSSPSILLNSGATSSGGELVMVRTFIAAVAVWASASIPMPAQAQIPYRGYAPPAGPSLPHQLEYFRPRSGVLDQYNQFVAPREQLAGQLSGIVQQQNRDYQAVERQIRESDKIRESTAAATGTAAGFMNYSHYYRARGPAGARPARQASPPAAGLGFGS
jgi:hypothetical protein